MFIVDPVATQHKWRLLSTRSNFIVTFPRSVSRVVVLKQLDSTGFHRVRVEFAQGQSPMADGASSYSCSIVDDPVMTELLHYRVDSSAKGGKGGKGGRSKGDKGTTGGKGT